MSPVEEDSKNKEKSQVNATFYRTLRLLAVISKFLGAFPLMHVTSIDGKKVKHSWFALIHVWDIAIGAGIIVYFMQSCATLLDQTEHTDNDDSLQIWLTLTCYIVTVRGLIQFILVHFYASRFPDLFTALEEYHQEIGASIIKPHMPPWLPSLMPIIRLLVILIIMEITSFFFFDQVNGESMMIIDAWPVATSFMFANLWRELPMNFFIFICKYLICRFREIQDEVRILREKGEKDKSKELETLRLQHAALSRILSQVQSCYGFQLSINILFLFLDTVMQLFVFFVITSSQNGILLVLALYFFFMSAALINIVERMERTDDDLLQEIAAFELCSTSRDQQLQVQLFTIQLTARPVRISASGFMVINNALICSLLGAVATYIVMLVQFTPYLQMTLANITLPNFW